MVGKDENAILCKRKDSGKHETDAQNGTYSRRMVERKTKFQTDQESDSNAEYLALVDGFVQDVIERAKEQYLSGCANGDIGYHGNSNDGQNRLKKGDDRDSERPKKKHDSKKSEKGKGRRKPHYKYSGPVDEKEISGYDNPEASALLNHDRAIFDIEEPGGATNAESVYHRTAALLRRLMSCCSGKT